MHKYYVESTEMITRSTLLLNLKRDHDEARIFSFQPGQYAAINTRGNRPSASRCFSIVSSPTDQDVLQFSMRVRGRFTTGLTKLKPGDEIDVRGPFGGFVIDTARDTSAVFLAGGIGITPFMSMMEYAARVALSNPITLVYSVANQDDVPFLDRLADLQRRNNRLRVVIVVAKGDYDKLSQFNVRTGYVNEELLDEVTKQHYFDTSFFLCGPPPFMNAALGILKKRGTPQDRMITEAFSQGSHRQSGKTISWPSNMYVLGALGFGLATLVVTIADIMKTLPKTPFANSDTLEQPLTSQSNRESDLDSLIAGHGVNTDNKVSPAAKKALDAAAKKSSSTSQAAQTAPSSSSTSTSSSTSSSLSSSTPTATPKPVPKPTPAPAPVCTTSQSGVTTCV